MPKLKQKHRVTSGELIFDNLERIIAMKKIPLYRIYNAFGSQQTYNRKKKEKGKVNGDELDKISIICGEPPWFFVQSNEW